MWTEITNSGKTRFVERFDDPITGKERKTSITVDKVTKAIEKQMPFLLQEKIDELIEKSIAKNSSKKKTFDDISKAWLEFMSHSVKASTNFRNATHVRAMSKVFGTKPFEDLDSSDFNLFVYEALKDGRFKYTTAKQLKSVFVRLIKYAIKYHRIDLNHIIDLLEVPEINLPNNNDLKYLETDEITKLFKYLESINEFEILRIAKVMIATGMRYSECISLNYDKDINLKENSIHVSKTYDKEHNLFTAPKTGKDRTVYINNELKSVILEQITISKKKVLKFNLGRSNKLLFVSHNGRPIDITYVNSVLTACPTVKKHITTHIFRHTFITKAVEAGVSKELIAKQVGHVDNVMIDRIYKHFSKTMQEKQKEAMLDLKII